MKSLTTIGRIIYAIPFIIFGINHFMYVNSMAGMLSGWPAPEILVYISGAGMILAGIAIITKLYAKTACLLLALMLLIFIVALHLPGLGNEATRAGAMGGLLKDTSLLGAALTYAGLLK